MTLRTLGAVGGVREGAAWLDEGGGKGWGSSVQSIFLQREGGEKNKRKPGGPLMGGFLPDLSRPPPLARSAVGTTKRKNERIAAVCNGDTQLI